MPIIKNVDEKNFAQISNELLQDEDLPYDTKGMLCELLSRPGNWEVQKSQLIRSYASEKKLRRLIKEAKSAGYMKTVIERGASGKIAQNVWFVASKPIFQTNTPDSPLTAMPFSGLAAKAPLLIKSNTNKETTTNKDNIKTSQNNSIPSSPGNSKVNTKSADVKIGNFPPLPAEVVKYADSIGFELDGETFCDYYASQGWKKANSQPLKDWQAAVRTWKRNDDSRKPDGPSEYTSEESRRVLFDSYIADGTLPPDTNYEQWSAQLIEEPVSENSGKAGNSRK